MAKEYKSFEALLKTAKIGEDICKYYFEKRNCTVLDARDLAQARFADIDFFIKTSKNIKITVEAKTDGVDKMTNNLIIETVSNKSKNRLGWAYISRAMYITIYQPVLNKFYILDSGKLKVFLTENGVKQYKHCTQYTPDDKDKKLYESECVLINKDILKNAGVIIRDYTVSFLN